MTKEGPPLSAADRIIAALQEEEKRKALIEAQRRAKELAEAAIVKEKEKRFAHSLTERKTLFDALDERYGITRSLREISGKVLQRKGKIIDCLTSKIAGDTIYRTDGTIDAWDESYNYWKGAGILKNFSSEELDQIAAETNRIISLVWFDDGGPKRSLHPSSAGCDVTIEGYRIAILLQENGISAEGRRREKLENSLVCFSEVDFKKKFQTLLERAFWNSKWEHSCYFAHEPIKDYNL